MRYGTPEEFKFKLDLSPPPEASLPVPVATPPQRGPRWGRWAAGALGVFILGAAAVETVNWVALQWERSAVLGAFFTGLLAIAAVAALLGILREWRVWRGLRDVERVRNALLAGEDPARLVERLAESVSHRPAAAADVARFRAQAASMPGHAQLVELFAAEVLRPLDRAAYAAVAKASRDTGVITAIAPTALLDTVLLLWRNIRMVREVAAIYGHRTGVAGTWLLMKRLASGAAVVAAADVAGTLIVQQLGGALADIVAAKLGEGAVAATRTARIGLWAMQLCRAVPFGEDDLPTMRRMAQSLVTRGGMM